MCLHLLTVHNRYEQVDGTLAAGGLLLFDGIALYQNTSKPSLTL